jgi:hypothetical protein
MLCRSTVCSKYSDCVDPRTPHINGLCQTSVAFNGLFCLSKNSAPQCLCYAAHPCCVDADWPPSRRLAIPNSSPASKQCKLYLSCPETSDCASGQACIRRNCANKVCQFYVDCTDATMITSINGACAVNTCSNTGTESKSFIHKKCTGSPTCCKDADCGDMSALHCSGCVCNDAPSRSLWPTVRLRIIFE